MTSLNRRQLIVALALAGFLPRVGLAQDVTGKTYFVGGLDSRDPEDPGRTDVMMLVRVDEDAETVRVLSIPRDLYVEVPGHDWNKINGVFTLGATANGGQDWEAGGALVSAMFSSAFGVEIANSATMDFAQFPAAIDALGGIDIDNPYTLYEVDGVAVQFEEGPLHLDGEQALEYVRHRHQDGDEGRVMRQQLVLEAALEKARTMDLGIFDVLGVVFEVVTTDISERDALQLVRFGSNLQEEDVTLGTIDFLLTEGETDAGEWIYEADWETLPTYVQDWLNGEIVD